MPRTVGIDLGTTYSLIAYQDRREGAPKCIPGPYGTPLCPSVVSVDADGSIIVGEAARRRLLTQSERTIYSVKRLMGRGPADVQDELKIFPFRIDPASKNVIRVRLGDRVFTPPEISAFILRELKMWAEEYFQDTVGRAVITVPAYFNDAQRQATRDAGRLAGIEVLRLLNEPTAAALAYGLDKQAEGTFAVFDLGGGTFDVSILKLQGGIFEVKATGGDSALGGDDFDRAIADAILTRLELRGDIDPGNIRRVLDSARALKETLTMETEAAIEIALVDRTATARLSRADMEALVAPVLARCAPSVRRALKDVGLEASALSGVILVGGATRMPLVRQFVEKLFGQPPLGDIDPDQVVALGAAVQADILAGGAGQGGVLFLAA